MSNLSFEISSRVVAVWIFVFVLATSGCRGDAGTAEVSKESTNVADKPIDPRSSETAKNDLATRLSSAFERRDCSTFFQAFPETFDAFNELYGFDDQEGPRILYEKYEDHLSFFYTCAQVPDADKLSKSIHLGIGGTWEADATSVLQEQTTSLILRLPVKAAGILDDLGDRKAASFWHFLFDGPHPTDKQVMERVDTVRNALGRESKQSRLLSEQYTKLQQESRND